MEKQKSKLNSDTFVQANVWIFATKIVPYCQVKQEEQVFDPCTVEKRKLNKKQAVRRICIE